MQKLKVRESKIPRQQSIYFLGHKVAELEQNHNERVKNIQFKK